MKAYDNGCFYSAQCDRRDVSNFKAQWPCSGVPNRPVWFQFDKRNGDLVDIEPEAWRNIDGGAVEALCRDAQTYAKARLNIQH